jgi:DNA primase
VHGRIPEDVIADIRDRTDIVQVIGQFVDLKRAGSNHRGLCPFHQEKTPSFNVNAAKQFYHCFGCQESGDVFSFLMKIEGRRFGEVIEDLAGKAGVELPKDQSPDQVRQSARKQDERRRGLELNARAARLYRGYLESDAGRSARAYLHERRIDQEQGALFQLGYAPASGSTLARALERADVSLEFAQRLGLVKRRREGDGFHDQFWNRLVFPLIDVRGDVLGFGGRLLQGDGPKYINTPETLLYTKGATLYGIHAASQSIRQKDVALLVEGNFDVLQMHQHGLSNAVAPMGTALTEAQVRLLHRFSSRLVAIFDGDKAGRAAARRAVPILVAAGLTAKVVSLPDGEDPDTFLRKNGAEQMQRLIDQAPHALDFMLGELRKQMEDSVPGRARILESMAPLVASLPSAVQRDLYVDQLALSLGVARDRVERVVRGDRTEKARAFSESPPRRMNQEGEANTDSYDGTRPKNAFLEPSELKLLALLLEYPYLFTRAERASVSILLTNADLRATYSAASEMQGATGEVDVAALLKQTSPNIRNVVAGVVQSREFANDGDPTKALDDCVSGLQKARLRAMQQAILAELDLAKKRGDQSAERELSLRLVEVSHKLMVEVEHQIHETR